MSKKYLTSIGLIILAIAVICKLGFLMVKNIKIDEFHKAAVTILIEATSSNTPKLEEEIKYIKSLCAILDPEDAIKIIQVSQSSYLIYEGTPGDMGAVAQAINKYAKGNSDKTSYGEAIKKSVEYSISMKKEGYRPAVIVVGSLDENGDLAKQINRKTLPDNIRKTKEYIPEFAMMFTFASPQKLDEIKTLLNPVLGEKKLIVANELNLDKANRRFLKALER